MHACKRWRWVPTLVAAVTAMLKGACWLKSMCVTGPNCKKRMLLSLATMTPMLRHAHACFAITGALNRLQ